MIFSGCLVFLFVAYSGYRFIGGKSGDFLIQGNLEKLYLRPTSALCSKFYPRNINSMPVVKFFACLDFERKS